jgi:AcrR family transcriptional regulator
MPRPADPHTKIDLLRAAEAVFVECGLDQGKVEQITARAGHSKGSFYLHFESKEDAFRQIVETFVARLDGCLDATQELFSRGPIPPAAYLSFWHEKDLEVFEFLWQNRRLVRLMLEGGKSAGFAYLIDEFAERSRRNLEKSLVWGMRAGLYRPGLDVELTSLAISGAYDRVARDLVRRERKPDLRRLCRDLQRFIVRGVGLPHLLAAADRVVNNSRLHRATARISPARPPVQRRSRS